MLRLLLLLLLRSIRLPSFSYKRLLLCVCMCECSSIVGQVYLYVRATINKTAHSRTHTHRHRHVSKHCQLIASSQHKNHMFSNSAAPRQACSPRARSLAASLSLSVRLCMCVSRALVIYCVCRSRRNAKTKAKVKTNMFTRQRVRDWEGGRQTDKLWECGSVSAAESEWTRRLCALWHLYYDDVVATCCQCWATRAWKKLSTSAEQLMHVHACMLLSAT